VNTPKRREHNSIYAAVNLTPEYNRRLRLTFVLLKLTTDRLEASRSLFATAELFVWSKLTTCSRHLRYCYIISTSQSWASFTSCRPTHPPAYPQISIPTSIDFGDMGVQKFTKWALIITLDALEQNNNTCSPSNCKCQPAHQILTYSFIILGRIKGVPK